MNITREQLDDILDAAELYEADDDSYDSDGHVTVTSDYSGRGMYGAACLGFTVSHLADAFKIAVAMGGVLGADEAREIAGKARSDSMGRDVIVYFPGVTLDA